MINREQMEKEYKPLFERRKFGAIVMVPLAAGFLSGVYNDGNLPEGSVLKHCKDSGKPRPTLLYESLMGDAVKAKYLKISNAVAQIAKEMGCT